jgi:asparagine N-glycosylation enzyme membrane subunit Stt3
MLLFIPSIINSDWNRFNALLTVLAVLYACVFVSVLIDLYFGVKRAKRLNIARTSFGYRRTITKLTSYFGLMLMLSIADIAASVVLKMPYFTVIGAIGIVMVEAKSVYENLKQQEKGVEEVQKALLKLFENREEIKSVISFLNAQNQISHDAKRNTQ